MQNTLRIVLVLVLLFTACSQNDNLMKNSNHSLIVELLNSKPEYFADVLKKSRKHRLQILYTQIDRDENNIPTFTKHGYRLQTEKYFYPASCVKFPAALLALEKLNDLNIAGLNKFTSLKIDSSFANQTAVVADSTSKNGLPSIAHYIKKIFLVSDNDAYNRMYEFIGQRTLMDKFKAKGFLHSNLIRRLSIPNTPEESRHTNAFTFFEGDEIIYRQPAAQNDASYKIQMRDTKQGKGHYSSGKLINKPLDFSHSNYVSIEDFQDFLIASYFPETLAPERRFNLTQADYNFLYKTMSMMPRESKYPAYSDTSIFNDATGKIFIYGDTQKPIPDNIRIFNKTGGAYGYLLDNAYIVDFENKVEFLLTAVIQVNENQIYNDDNYEYKEIGVPFLANLGRVIYNYEKHREKMFQPDLSKFKVHEN